MIYGYVRVSTDKQVLDNQKFEITKYCESHNLHVDIWIEEHISGTKDYEKRRLGLLIKRLKKDDILLCSELSRLGRSLFMIMDILNICMRKGTKVWTIKENYRLGDDIKSKVLAFAFGLSAEIERNLISQRTKESLLRLKAEGKVLGRPKGSKNHQSAVFGQEDFIKGKIEQGMKMKEIAKRIHIHPNTLTKYAKIYCPQKYKKCA